LVIGLQANNLALQMQDTQLASENQALQKQIHQLHPENAVLCAHLAVLVPAIPLPEHFDGVAPNSEMYASDPTKIGLVASLLAGEVLDWASPLLETNSPVLSNWGAFQRAISTIFGNLTHSDELTQVKPPTGLDAFIDLYLSIYLY
uniref:DUF4939 domain-containing protein n=1 Tax=Terrapene triunguis TaxID=2587831 RepID=A0A674JC45_9SAUR